MLHEFDGCRRDGEYEFKTMKSQHCFIHILVEFSFCRSVVFHLMLKLLAYVGARMQRKSERKKER